MTDPKPGDHLWCRILDRGTVTPLTVPVEVLSLRRKHTTQEILSVRVFTLDGTKRTLFVQPQYLQESACDIKVVEDWKKQRFAAARKKHDAEVNREWGGYW